jgi:hypothetical protein
VNVNGFRERERLLVNVDVNASTSMIYEPVDEPEPVYEPDDDDGKRCSRNVAGTGSPWPSRRALDGAAIRAGVRRKGELPCSASCSGASTGSYSRSGSYTGS